MKVDSITGHEELIALKGSVRKLNGRFIDMEKEQREQKALLVAILDKLNDPK